MGLFPRKANPEAELAKALATQGVTGRAAVVSMTETGQERDGVAKEIEFVLDLDVAGAGTVPTSSPVTSSWSRSPTSTPERRRWLLPRRS
jgi:hypothetical protein